ncbi:MAG: TldD/PmbA family protein [Deltaproteobacteria bacterium]|nr:TldD/PmbA family protein [Deltaproteobacteria bacterium]
MDSVKAVDYLLALAREHHLPDVDVMLERGESLSVRVFRGRVEKLDQSATLGVGVRVVDQGRTGLAFTERLSESALETVFLAAKENARLMDPTEVVMAPPQNPAGRPEDLELYNPALESLKVEDLTRLALEIEALARQEDPRLAEVTSLGVSRSSGETRVVSTHGLDTTQRANRVGAYCQVLLKQGDFRKSGGHSWSRREWNPAEAAQTGPQAVRRGAALLGAAPLPHGPLAVVLDEHTAPQLLGMFFGAFSGEAAQKGQSPLKGRLGDQIGGKTVTLLDDPHRVGAGGSRWLDPEGIATRPLTLIQNGVFANFLYHVESARREGGLSTGHAGRSLGGGVSTRLHNLVMPLGGETVAQLAAMPTECLLVTDLEGGSGCNGLNGDISIGVQGILYRDGQPVRPVDSVTIAGNFYDLLNHIQGVGNFYQPNLSSLFIPPLLVEGLVAAGE